MSEKIGDVLVEMRSARQFYGAEYRALADRIDAAIARLKEEYANAQKNISALRAEVSHKQELNQGYCQEIARLRAALKPVVECRSASCDVLQNRRCADVIREAKRIWGRCDSSENARGLDGEVGR